MVEQSTWGLERKRKKERKKERNRKIVLLKKILNFIVGFVLTIFKIYIFDVDDQTTKILLYFTYTYFMIFFF